MHYLEIVLGTLDVLGKIAAIMALVFVLAAFIFSVSTEKGRPWINSKPWRLFWRFAFLPIMVLGIPAVVVWCGG